MLAAFDAPIEPPEDDLGLASDAEAADGEDGGGGRHPASMARIPRGFQAAKPAGDACARAAATLNRDMRPASLLPCLLALGLLGAEATTSQKDLDELEALKADVRKRNPDPGTAKPAAPATVATGAKSIRVQVIRSDRESAGFELVLILDAPVPTPAIIRGSGHAVGEKLDYEGTFEGAAKFEGAYYPFLKSSAPAPVVVAAPVVAPAEPDPIVSDTDEMGLETAPGFNAFTLSKILFAGFAIISIAMVVLRTKAKIEERAIRRHRKR